MTPVTELHDPGIRELLDRQKCYEVLSRYCRALDRADLELMKSVYWEDAVDAHGIFEGNAWEFSAYIIDGIQQWFEAATHYIGNVHMDYYGEAVYTESCLISYCSVAGTPGKVEAVFGPSYRAAHAGGDADRALHAFLMGGRYIDRLEKRSGEWRIARRLVVMDWNENWPGNGIYEEGMFRQLRRRGCRGRADPVYANRPPEK